MMDDTIANDELNDYLDNLSGNHYAASVPLGIPEWAKENRRILNEIGEVTDGIVKEGKAHKAKMSELGISAGFNEIFKGDRNG